MEYEIKFKINVSCKDENLVKSSLKKIISKFLDNQSFISSKDEILIDFNIKKLNNEEK